MNESLIPHRGNYKKLLSYQKSDVIFQLTFYFCQHYLQRGDRTIDQMVQAARSGKQNIVEGCMASATSAKTEIKLLNVAKASLQELLVDYEDYLRVRGLKQWQMTDEQYLQSIAICRSHNDSAFYREKLSERSDETVANIAIILIHQTDYLLTRLFERLKQDFIKEGGVKEQMYKARMSHLKKNY